MALNDALYRSLVRAFGRVRVQKEATPMGYRVLSTLTGSKRLHVGVGQGGEDYKVNCPFCGDTKMRLEINHRWNTRDTESGLYFGSRFMTCYNDGCDANRDATAVARQRCHERLQEMLKPYALRSAGITIKQAPVRDVPPAKLPDKCVPVDTLSPEHNAIRYLRDYRGFDPYRISQDYRVLYCIDDKNDFVAGRLIIPVYMDGKLMGWQARYVGEPDGDKPPNGKPPSDNIPKYYTMPFTPRNSALYNYDKARQHKFVVLMEGPTDVWRLGAQGLSSLGAAVGTKHIQLLTALWVDTGIGLMLDPDYVNKPRKQPDTPTTYETLIATLRRDGMFKWGVLEIPLPEGTDPGALPTDALWEHIEAVAAASGYHATSLREE